MTHCEKLLHQQLLVATAVEKREIEKCLPQTAVAAVAAVMHSLPVILVVAH